MKLDSIIKKFLPREERFQELLLKDTQNLTRAAELFLAIARSTKLEDRRIKLVELKALEHEGDEMTRQVFEALNRSFITPLDREDIRSIAVDLDDILDYLEGSALSLVIFQIDEAAEPLTRFAEILLEMVGQIDSVTRLIWDLGNEAEVWIHAMRTATQAEDGFRLTYQGHLLLFVWELDLEPGVTQVFRQSFALEHGVAAPREA